MTGKSDLAHLILFCVNNRTGLASIYLFLLISLSVQWAARAQTPIDSLRRAYDKLYGPDILLINGKKYLPDANPSEGHPFWGGKEPFNAELFVDGKAFPEQNVRYNLCEQMFLLNYQDDNRQPVQIILNPGAIDSVRIHDFLFIRNRNPEIGQRFIQRVYEGKLSCYQGWYKERAFQTFGNNKGLYLYSEAKKTPYLIKEGRVYRFHSKRTFQKIFPKEKQSLIRKFLISHNIRLKGIGDNDLRRLIIYCETI